jgi:hypothetical protein
VVGVAIESRHGPNPKLRQPVHRGQHVSSIFLVLVEVMPLVSRCVSSVVEQGAFSIPHVDNGLVAIH